MHAGHSLALTDPRLCQFAPAIPTIKSACTNFDFLGPADLAEFGTQTSQLVDACRDILATDTAAITSFCQYREQPPPYHRSDC